MIIVGELINASRQAVGDAIKREDHAFIKKLALDQAEAGATYIDVNAGIFVGKEGHYMEWLINNIKAVTTLPCSVDSPDPKVIEQGLKLSEDDVMINSISLEKDRLDAILPLVAGTSYKIVALCMDDEKMPETMEQRLKIADVLINKLVQNNVKLENIFVDPLVQPISTDKTFGMGFIDSVSEVMKNYEGIHTICGLSNISYGLPERKFLNRNFAVMAIAKGLDGLLIDPLDKKMMSSICAAETLVGRDDFNVKYLKSYRKKKLEV
ncbi:dihydropteroate synthase [Acetobacterium carbinolicum]|uniref:dihydropteroate synthase n=1 Tax=Acetobacterium carbinolicum TaxID=52690 RepID=UPI0039BFD6F0